MTQVEKIMSALGCTEQEALDVIECDKAIDKGADPFPLSADQKKAEKKMRQADRKPTVYKFEQRTRKADEVKAEIMRKLLDCFDEYNPQVVNAEREFTFTYADRKFKIVLSAPRS